MPKISRSGALPAGRASRAASSPESAPKRPLLKEGREKVGRFQGQISPSATSAATRMIFGFTPATTIAGGRSTGKVSFARAPGR
jgi:hypothetical protein